MWVIAGMKNGIAANKIEDDVWSSTDGESWVEATNDAAFSSRQVHASVVYDNKMWVAGGRDTNDDYLNDVWHSTDGVIWTEATPGTKFTARAQHTLVVLNNIM